MALGTAVMLVDPVATVGLSAPTACGCMLGQGRGAQPPADVPVSGLCASHGQLQSLQEAAEMAVKTT